MNIDLIHFAPPLLGYITTAVAAAISAVTAAASTAVGVYSSVEQAKTAKEAAKYNEEALAAEARNREALAAESIRRERIQNRRKIAELRNNLAQNGTLSTEGTPLAIISESSANLELRIQDAARAASEQSKSLQAQAAMGLWEGGQQANAGYLQAGGSALSGIGSGMKGYLSDVKNGLYSDVLHLSAPPKATPID